MIMGYLEILIGKPEVKENKDIMKNIRIILNNVNRLQELVETLLNYSRLESGRFTIQKQVLSIAQICEFLTDLSSSLATGLDIDFSIDNRFQNDTILFDYEKLKQIATNLITNAFKFTEKGTIHIKLSGNKDTYLSIQVSDTGIGIPKDRQEQMFGEYERIEVKRGDQVIPGTGLGLYIVKRLVKTLNGTITVESELGKGSTFTVNLPTNNKGF